MDPDAIREFAARNWADLAAAKNRAWVASKRTPAADLLAADDLRRYVLRLRPDWPSAIDRTEDQRNHIRVSEALGAVSVRLR